MRVRPNAWTAVGVFLGYVLVVAAVWISTGLKYDEVGDSVKNVREGVVVAIGLGTIYLVVVTSLLGWWRPAIREPRRVGGGWMWLVPAFLVVGVVSNLAATKWGDIPDAGLYLATLAVGIAFVGFSEELLTRGLAIVGARGSMHENRVWFFSAGLFGLLHVPNALFGQGAGGTVVQVVFAFFVGIAYYVTRRISGTLVVTMVLHFFWDFSLFAQAQSTDGKSIGGFLMYAAIVVAVVALVKILRDGDVVEPGGDQVAALDAPHSLRGRGQGVGPLGV